MEKVNSPMHCRQLIFDGATALREFLLAMHTTVL